MTTTSLGFAALSIDGADPTALAGFWGSLLGRTVTPGAVPGDMSVEATNPEGGPRMLFREVSEAATVKKGLRPVLITEHYDEEIARVTGLGATTVKEAALPAVRWTTFADPEGNEFDVVTWQSE